MSLVRTSRIQTTYGQVYTTRFRAILRHSDISLRNSAGGKRPKSPSLWRDSDPKHPNSEEQPEISRFNQMN
jgi:hypothetical protein